MKNFTKELQEKMQTELPKSLQKDNILEKLEAVESSKVVPFPMPKEKKSNQKIWLSFVASFVLVFSALTLVVLHQSKIKETPKENPAPLQAENYEAIFKTLQAAKNNQNVQQQPGNATDQNINGGYGSPENSEEVNKEFGTTNVQEKGVDESNMILTDGEYIYALNTSNYTIGIVQAKNGQMTLLSTIPIRETEEDMLSGLSMYYYQNHIVLVGTKYKEPPAQDLSNGALERSRRFDYEEISTFVKIYDVTEKSSPTISKSYVQEGHSVSSRRIENRIYLVTQRAIYLDSQKPEEDWIPKIYNNGMEKKLPASKILVDEAVQAPSYVLIGTIDILSDTEATATAVLGDCNFIYVSKQNIYTVTLSFGDAVETTIHKYAMTEQGIEALQCGKVSGMVPNAFALSEENGFLRVVTELDLTTQVHILDETMQSVGSLKDLAKEEEIKSTRFMGDTLYLVTFYQTDPLFVIDLSNPKEPTVKGEVKVPGFSQYLHPISDTLLLGIGPDGTEKELNGNMKISLFDVQKPAKPKEMDKAYALEKGDTQHSAFSMVIYEHRLFVSLPNQEFAVPFEILGTGNSTYRYSRYKIENNQIQKVADYVLPNEQSQIFGATFIGNEFYILSYSAGLTASLTSYSMTNSEILTEVDF